MQIDIKPHVQRAIRSMELEAQQLNQQLAELNSAYQETLKELLPPGATLDDYELKRGKGGEALALVLKPRPEPAEGPVAETAAPVSTDAPPAPEG